MISTFPFILSNIKMGEVSYIGNELHFEVYPQYHHKWALHRKSVREELKKFSDKNDGLVTTRSGIDDISDHRFLARLGFSKTWQDEYYIYFILANLPFERLHHVKSI